MEQPDLVPALHEAVAAFSRLGANVVNAHILLERRERERHKGVQIGQSARQSVFTAAGYMAATCGRHAGKEVVAERVP